MSPRKLRYWYNRSTGGHTWYREAGRTARQLAEAYGVPVTRAAGVIAALSPRMRWSENVKNASKVLAAAAAGEVAPPRVGMTRFVATAWRIAKGERPLAVLGGPKVRAFYRNLCGDLSHVTVDVWALRALGVDAAKGMRPGEYERAAAHYRRAARAAGVAPAVFQAVVWTSIRGAST